MSSLLLDDEAVKSDKFVCPKCGYIEDEYYEYVTYWGDDGSTQEYQCTRCETIFDVEEFVTRTWAFKEKGKEPNW